MPDFWPRLVQVKTSPARQVYWRGLGQGLLVNLDQVTTVYLVTDEGGDAFSQVVGILGPLGTFTVAGDRDIWALTQAGSAVVNSLPGIVEATSGPVITGTPIASAQAASAITGVPFNAQSFVLSYASLRLRVAGLALASAGVTVTLTWYADASKAVTVGSAQWVLTTGASLDVLVPNLGPFVTLSVSTVSASAVTFQVALIPMTVACSSPRYLAVGNDQTVTNFAVAASSTSVAQLLPFVAEGPGILFVDPRDATGKLNVLVWKLGQGGGQVAKVAEVDGATVPVTVQVQGSSSPLAYFITNTDSTGPHSIDVRLSVDGR